MKNLRLSTLLLTLAIAVFSLGYVNPAFADKPVRDCGVENPHPSCKDDDDSSPSENLSATFCLTIDESLDPLYIQSDGKSPTADSDEYCDDKKKKVAAFTGSGDGFRWDTNMQNTNKTQQWMKWRWVHLNIDGHGSAAHGDESSVHPDAIFEIDFRFNQTVGLDLGSLDAQDNGSCVGTCDGEVAATIRYYAGHTVGGYDFENYGILGFGAVNTPFPTAQADLDCLADSGMIKVTRTSPTEWTLESQKGTSQKGTACRFSLDEGGNKCTFTNERCPPDSINAPRQIDFDFKFTIKQQE